MISQKAHGKLIAQSVNSFVNRLGLNRLNEKSYNKLAEYLPNEVDVCHICRNTLALQQSNSLQEISLASSKMKSMETFCETVKNIDFDSLATQLGTIESLNLHLQHLLIDKESLKENQERLLRVDGTVSGSDNQISQLQEQVSEHLNRPEPEITGPSSSTNELLAVISSKLNQISTEEPLISVELASLKSSVDALEKTASAVSQLPQNRIAAEVPSELPSSAKQYDMNSSLLNYPARILSLLSWRTNSVKLLNPLKMNSS